MTPSGIRNISVEVAATALSAGANTVVTLPAQTAILAAGVEVTEALAGASALTFDLGTGFDDDAFASGYAMAGKSVGAVAPMAGGMADFGAQDTLDITVDTLTGTATGGKLRVWAMVMDVDGKGAEEVDRDYLA